MQQQPVSTIKSLSLLHFSLLIGQIVFAAIAYYLHTSGIVTIIDVGDNLTLFVQLIGTVGLLLAALSFFLYKKKVVSIKSNAQPVKEKLMAYRAASLIRWAMLEAPVLLGIIAFMLIGHYNFLIIAGAIIIMFITTRPSASRAAAELSLSEDEVNN